MSYQVMQIETSNVCSLRCRYCPHPKQKRPKGHMSFQTFERCIDIVLASANPVYCSKQFVWLNHFGEPLLNPDLPIFVKYAVNRGVEVSFSSNGVDENKHLFTRSVWQQLAEVGLKAVIISAHSMERDVYREHLNGIVDIVSFGEPTSGSFHDWAGQISLQSSDCPANSMQATQPCDYELNNMFAITWDGRIAACCYDIEARTGSTIDDVVSNGYVFKQISLCKSCSLGRGDSNWIDMTSAKVPKIIGDKLKLASASVTHPSTGEPE